MLFSRCLAALALSAASVASLAFIACAPAAPCDGDASCALGFACVEGGCVETFESVSGDIVDSVDSVDVLRDTQRMRAAVDVREAKPVGETLDELDPVAPAELDSEDIDVDGGFLGGSLTFECNGLNRCWNTFEDEPPAHVPTEVVSAVDEPRDVSCAGLAELDTSISLDSVAADGLAESTELCGVVVGARDVAQIDGAQLRVFVTRDLVVAGMLKVRGPRAPVFLVHGEMLVDTDGIIDVRGEGQSPGPGVSTELCVGRKGVHATARNGGSGASHRGRGGRGGGGVQALDALAAEDGVLRAGCFGGDGGDGSGNGGKGGAGGGALQISAAAGLRLSGVITAVGGAGQGGRKQHAGGGGGGAGGMVQLEAGGGFDLDGADSFRSRVKVGGGGGGSGATDDRDGRTGIDGGDGADFGPGKGGDGGGTAVNELDDGRSGITVQTGKGGGGGGRGRIVARDLF